MVIYGREIAETSCPTLDELEASMSGLLRLALLLVVDVTGISGASLEAFRTGVAESEGRARSLLSESSLSERQRACLKRVGRTVEACGTIGQAAPHVQRLSAFLSGGPLSDSVGAYLGAVRRGLAERGVGVVVAIRSRDAAVAAAQIARLQEETVALQPHADALLDAARHHQGACQMSRATLLVVGVLWGELEAISRDWAQDLSREAPVPDALLQPLRRAA